MPKKGFLEPVRKDVKRAKEAIFGKPKRKGKKKKRGWL